jgi:hypothetical protein
MIVRCQKSIVPTNDADGSIWRPDLTLGKEYKVWAIEDDHYRLLGDDGKPFLYPLELFVVVDWSVDPEWVVQTGDDGERCEGPEALLAPGLFEDYFDGISHAVKVVEDYMAGWH